jgi:hypothetical protein
MTPMGLSPLLGTGVLEGPRGLGIKPSSISTKIAKEEPETCAENVPERGHQPTVQGNEHFVYGADGYYIKAAVCYIQRQLKSNS